MPDNQTSDTTRADIARANGAKSKGPKTPEGKAISSRNALRHGLRSRKAVLPHKSDPSYRAILRSYVAQFQPQTSVELDLVAVMAVARWRLGRLLSIETHMLANHLAKYRDRIASYVENPDSEKSIALAFASLSSGSSLSRVPRHEGSLHRSFNRAFKQLQTLRAQPIKNMNQRTQALDDLNPSS
jgi:hypothetical protein